jgi:hypothetical protein
MSGYRSRRKMRRNKATDGGFGVLRSPDKNTAAVRQ